MQGSPGGSRSYRHLGAVDRLGERAQLRRVLDAGRRLGPARRRRRRTVRRGDRCGDVLRRQAAGQDQRDLRAPQRTSSQSNVSPVPRAARAVRVDQVVVRVEAPPWPARRSPAGAPRGLDDLARRCAARPRRSTKVPRRRAAARRRGSVLLRRGRAADGREDHQGRAHLRRLRRTGHGGLPHGLPPARHAPRRATSAARARPSTGSS